MSWLRDYKRSEQLPSITTTNDYPEARANRRNRLPNNESSPSVAMVCQVGHYQLLLKTGTFRVSDAFI